MLNEINNSLRDLVPESHDLVVVNDKSQIYSNLKYNGTRYFISPIKDAVSTPSIIRGFHRKMSESNPYVKWRNMIDEVIRSAYRLFVEMKGLDNAERWQIDAISESQKVLAARGPIGFFEEETGYSWIIKEERDEIDSIQKTYFDVLVFRNGTGANDIIKIAERNNNLYQIEQADKEYSENKKSKSGNSPEGYDGMDLLDEQFRELLSSLQKLYRDWAYQSQRIHHHLFCWSNDNIESFKSSFVKESLQKYLSVISNEYLYSVYGIIFCRLQDDLQTVIMTDLERLSMKRIRPGSLFFVSEGSENIGVELINKYLSKVGVDFDYLNTTRSELSKHECQLETKKDSEVAVIFPIWDGMWKESRHIDGEQIIFDN